MKISKKGIDLIKKFEGCSLVAYKCPSGIWTIGYGHTGGVEKGQKITQKEADSYFINDIKRFELYVEDNVKIKLNQNQFDALVSFTYNCGVANLRKLTNNRNTAAIAAAIPLYNKSNGKTLEGLKKRRQEEYELFIL